MRNIKLMQSTDAVSCSDLRQVSLLLGLAIVLCTPTVSASTVPDLLGLSEQDARGVLEQAGHTGKVHVTVSSGAQCDDKSLQQGHVCAQKPVRDQQLIPILDVFLVIQGKRAIPKIEAFTLPTSVSPDKARELILDRGFTGTVEVSLSNEPGVDCKYLDRQVGNICAQTPSGRNGKVPADSAWNLVVQAERTKWDAFGYIPNVIGEPVIEALAKLSDDNFSRLLISFYESTTCAPMMVCDLGAGLNSSGHNFKKLVNKQLDVRLVVGSQYPETSPEEAVWSDLEGDTLRVAIEKIDASGLNSDRKGKYPFQVIFADVKDLEEAGFQNGQVAAQKAVPGLDLRRMQALTVVRQRMEGQKDGKRWVRMPALAGLSLDEARAQLIALEIHNISVKNKAVTSRCGEGLICSTSPGEGERAFLEATQLVYLGMTMTETNVQEEPEQAADSSPDGIDPGEIANDVGDDTSDDDFSFDIDGQDTDIPGYEPLF